MNEPTLFAIVFIVLVLAIQAVVVTVLLAEMVEKINRRWANTLLETVEMVHPHTQDGPEHETETEE